MVYRLIVPTLAAALLGGQCPARSLPAARRGSERAPMVIAGQAGPFRVVVERVIQNTSLTLDFAPSTDEVDATDGRQSIYIYLAVEAPDRDHAAGIVSLGKNLTATTDSGQTLPLRTYSAGETGSPDSRIWRTYMLAQDVGLQARRLQTVSGELLVHRRSRALRMEFPLRERLPQTQVIEGVRVTLQDYRWENGTATVVLVQQWPAGSTVTRLRPEMPFWVTALTVDGVPAYANEGRSKVTDGKTAAPSQMLRLVYPDLQKPPDRIRFEALVRIGAAEPLPFQLGEIPLPAEEVQSAEPRSAASQGVTPADHPALVSDGGAPVRFLVKVNGRPAGPGILSVGLSSAGIPGGAWRWLTVSTDTSGGAVIPNLRPGRYRAALNWSPASEGRGSPEAMITGRDGRWVNEKLEFTAAVGKLVELPALEWRASD